MRCLRGYCNFCLQMVSVAFRHGPSIWAFFLRQPLHNLWRIITFNMENIETNVNSMFYFKCIFCCYACVEGQLYTISQHVILHCARNGWVPVYPFYCASPAISPEKNQLGCQVDQLCHCHITPSVNIAVIFDISIRCCSRVDQLARPLKLRDWVGCSKTRVCENTSRTPDSRPLEDL